MWPGASSHLSGRDYSTLNSLIMPCSGAACRSFASGTKQSERVVARRQVDVEVCRVPGGHSGDSTERDCRAVGRPSYEPRVDVLQRLAWRDANELDFVRLRSIVRDLDRVVPSSSARRSS